MASRLECEISAQRQSLFDELTRPQIKGIIIYDAYFEFCKKKL